MTKTVKINTNDGTRRIELDAPPIAKRAYLMSRAPIPLKMNIKSVNWVIEIIESTTTVDPESMDLESGFDLFVEISHYWGELNEDTDEKTENKKFSDVPIDEYGMVDVEDMR